MCLCAFRKSIQPLSGGCRSAVATVQPPLHPVTISVRPGCCWSATTLAPSGHCLCRSSVSMSHRLAVAIVVAVNFGYRLCRSSALSGHRPTVFQSCVWSVRLCGRLFGPFDPSYCVLCLFGHLCLVHPSVSFQRYWLMSGLHPHLLRLLRPFGVNRLRFWFRFRFRLSARFFF